MKISEKELRSMVRNELTKSILSEGLSKGDEFSGRVAGSKYKVATVSNNLDDVEMEVVAFPSNSSAVGKKFKISQISDKAIHPLALAVKAAMDSAPSSSPSSTSAETTPEEKEETEETKDKSGKKLKYEVPDYFGLKIHGMRQYTEALGIPRKRQKRIKNIYKRLIDDVCIGLANSIKKEISSIKIPQGTFIRITFLFPNDDPTKALSEAKRNKRKLKFKGQFYASDTDVNVRDPDVEKALRKAYRAIEIILLGSRVKLFTPLVRDTLRIYPTSIYVGSTEVSGGVAPSNLDVDESYPLF